MAHSRVTWSPVNTSWKGLGRVLSFLYYCSNDSFWNKILLFNVLRMKSTHWLKPINLIIKFKHTQDIFWRWGKACRWMPLITLLISFTTSQKGHDYSIRIYLSLKTISMSFGFDTWSSVSGHRLSFFWQCLKAISFIFSYMRKNNGHFIC